MQRVREHQGSVLVICLEGQVSGDEGLADGALH